MKIRIHSFIYLILMAVTAGHASPGEAYADHCLANPSTEWNHPVLMSYGEENHAVRTNRWRYIRYSDGGQELYDMAQYPFGYTNLSGNPEYSGQMQLLNGLLNEMLPWNP